jgi:hypothetical protein
LRLQSKTFLDNNQADAVQQVISLRHAAVHHVLPDVPAELMHQLLYCKFLREVVKAVFPTHAKDPEQYYLSLASSDLTTYASKFQKLVSGVKKSPNDKRLVWLMASPIPHVSQSRVIRSHNSTSIERYRWSGNCIRTIHRGKIALGMNRSELPWYGLAE